MEITQSVPFDGEETSLAVNGEGWLWSFNVNRGRGDPGGGVGFPRGDCT